MKEIFRRVRNFPNYEVSNLGTVRNITTQRILKGVQNLQGYSTVCLSKGGKSKTCAIHKLVMQAFNPDEYDKHKISDTIIHIDNDLTNNNIENLRYANPDERISHRYMPRDLKHLEAMICSTVHKVIREYAEGRIEYAVFVPREKEDDFEIV